MFLLTPWHPSPPLLIPPPPPPPLLFILYILHLTTISSSYVLYYCSFPNSSFPSPLPSLFLSFSFSVSFAASSITSFLLPPLLSLFIHRFTSFIVLPPILHPYSHPSCTSRSCLLNTPGPSPPPSSPSVLHLSPFHPPPVLLYQPTSLQPTTHTLSLPTPYLHPAHRPLHYLARHSC